MGDKTYRIDTNTVVDGTITARKFIGVVDGQIEEAIVAQKDYQGQNIDETYVKGLDTADGVSIVPIKGDDTEGTPVMLRSYTAGTGLSSNVYGTVDTFSVDYGNTAGTACEGNDPRLNDAREPLPHEQSTATITSLSGYSVPQITAPLTTDDTLNEALGKLEKGLSGKQDNILAASPISLNNNTISHDTSGITAGTYTKITVDEKGHATAGSQITIADLGLIDDDLLNVMQQQVPVSNPNEYNLLMSTGVGTDYTVGYVTKSAATSQWVNGKGTILSTDVFKGDVETDNISSGEEGTPVHIESDIVIGSPLVARQFTHYGNSNITGTTNLDGNVNVGGNVAIEGTLIVKEGHIEHYEDLYVKDQYLLLRDGATTGLTPGDYSGLQVKLYDGVTDGRLVIDNTGTARVGDVGDEQPLLTRAESANMTSGAMLKWDSANVKAVTATPDDVFAAAGFTFEPVDTDQ